MLDAGIGDGHATMWTGSLVWFGVAVARPYVTPAIANLAYPAGAGNRIASNGEISPGASASRVGYAVSVPTELPLMSCRFRPILIPVTAWLVSLRTWPKRWNAGKYCSDHWFL